MMVEKFSNFKNVNENLNDDVSTDFFYDEKITIVYDYEMGDLLDHAYDDFYHYAETLNFKITDEYLKKMVVKIKKIIKKMIDENDGCSPSVDGSQFFYDIINKYYNDDSSNFFKEIAVKELKAKEFNL